VGLCVPVGAGRAASAVDVSPCARLGIIGDSLTVQSQAALEARLRANGIEQFRIDAMGGRVTSGRSGISTGVQALKRLKAARYRVGRCVVALGTNDIRKTARASDYQKWMRAMLDEVGDHPVLWIGPAYKPGIWPARTALYNDTLADVVADYPQAEFVDWRPFWI